MDKTNEEQAKEYAEAGIDLPELEEKEPEKEPETPEAEPKEPEKEPEEEATAPLQEPKEQRKRSIYDEYKDKKSELKAEREAREQAERERDELAEKLKTASVGTKTDAEDAVAYAEKVGADPDLVKRIIDEARKGLKAEPDESLKRDLEDFKAWRTQNNSVIEEQMFEREFQETVPALKELFPALRDEDVPVMRKELDTLSHTKEWHDKSLDFIAFKNREHLAAFISPKKKGMETKGRKETVSADSEFDPNADLSSMSASEAETWWEQYNNAAKSKGLLVNAQGKKTIL